MSTQAFNGAYVLPLFSEIEQARVDGASRPLHAPASSLATDDAPLGLYAASHSDAPARSRTGQGRTHCPPASLPANAAPAVGATSAAPGHPERERRAAPGNRQPERTRLRRARRHSVRERQA
ncbi:hypothetical protein AB0941_27255 [Streptomyces sp. NPDC013433]|uniref:hypothetical protein n=1 Tax=Streptomyces sp. NPDC013433 TaxID=3155604 RepID=UPI0034532CC7